MSSVKRDNTSQVADRMYKVIFVKNVEKLIYILQVIGGVTGQNVFIKRTLNT